MQLFSIEIIAEKAVLHLATYHLHKKRSRIAALPTKDLPSKNTAIISAWRKSSHGFPRYIQKAAEDIFPKWEKSSAVFVYRCAAVWERPSAQLSVCIKDIFGWSEQGYSDWLTLRYCSCCSWFIAVSAYNKKWDRQPLLGKPISFFRWGYFATAPLL